MSVVVSCRCGQQFKTDDRHAGKRVPCPACGSHLTIPAAKQAAPQPSLPDQGVRVQCPCGWAFRAPLSCEGKTVRCPGCNGGIVVPERDPLGVGRLTTPIESLPALPRYSGAFGSDSTERLAKQLAWVAGISVALMAFGMVITYLVFRFPISPANAPAVASVERQAPQRDKPPVTKPAERPAEPVAEKPSVPIAADARVAVIPAPEDRPVRVGPTGPRGPRLGPRGPGFGPAAPTRPTGNASESTNNSSSDESATVPDASASPPVAAGPAAVTKLPGSVQAWFEQPGDKLTGLRRVGSSETPNSHFSWLTGLLPYLDHGPVYDKIDFKQPVESKGNLQAGATQIPAFLNPLDDHQRWKGYPFDGLALTHFAGMSGVEDSRNVVAAKLPRSDPRAGVFGYDEVARPAQITDGQSQTIMMVGAGVLTNPWLFGGGGTIRGAREPLFDKKSGLGMKGLSGGGTIVVMADGSVRHVTEKVDPRVFKAMSTIHGADSVDLDRDAPSFALDQLPPTNASGPHSSYSNQRPTGR